MVSAKLICLLPLFVSSVSPLVIRTPTCAVCPLNVISPDNTTYYLMAASGDAPGTPEFCGYTANTTVNDMDFFCTYGNTGRLSSDTAGFCPSVTETVACTTPE